jgi:hypothetical protein
MSTQFNPITTDEYFNILSQDTLKPEDIAKKEHYEQYIKLCEKYENYLSSEVESILAKHNEGIMKLGNKEKKTSNEAKVLQDLQQRFENNNEVNEHKEGPVRKLAKSGFIDATVIIVVILNVGFIIAMTILGR